MELSRNADGSLVSVEWPGMCPIVYFDKKHDVICPDCANKLDKDDDLKAVQCDVNYEDTYFCCECGKEMKGAYVD